MVFTRVYSLYSRNSDIQCKCICIISQNQFRTPVYTTSERRNAMGVGLVFEADLATTDHISHWVLQGVCLVLNTD